MGIMSEMSLEMWERNRDDIGEPETDLPVDETEEVISGVLDSIRAIAREQAVSEAEDDNSVTPSEALPEQIAADSRSDKGKTADKESDEEAQRRREHEEAEAKRKIQWEEKQKSKKEMEEATREKIAAMSDEEVMTASAERAEQQTEKLTRRNMKICVTNVIQAKCREDVEFARMVMNPRKDMTKCFRYINRKALEFIREEQKATGEENSDRQQGMIGGDVPDDICYQWATDYFRETDAEEDKEKEDKFVSKPYQGKAGAKSKGKSKPAEKKPVEKPKEPSANSEQLSFGLLEGVA